MDNIETFGDDIKDYENISSHSDCMKKCKGTKECFVWTYADGVCYLKDEDMFTSFNPYVISGMKDCEGKGKHAY